MSLQCRYWVCNDSQSDFRSVLKIMAVAMFRGVGRALYGRIQRLHDVGGFNHPIYNYIYIYIIGCIMAGMEGKNKPPRSCLIPSPLKATKMQRSHKKVTTNNVEMFESASLYGAPWPNLPFLGYFWATQLTSIDSS